MLGTGGLHIARFPEGTPVRLDVGTPLEGLVATAVWTARSDVLVNLNGDELWLFDPDTGSARPIPRKFDIGVYRFQRPTVDAADNVVVGADGVDGSILVRSPLADPTQRQTVEVSGEFGSLYQLEWSPDGTRLASFGSTSSWFIIGVGPAAQTPSYVTSINDAYAGFSWTPDGRGFYVVRSGHLERMALDGTTTSVLPLGVALVGGVSA